MTGKILGLDRLFDPINIKIRQTRNPSACFDRIKRLVAIDHQLDCRTDHRSHRADSRHIILKIAFADLDLDRAKAAGLDCDATLERRRIDEQWNGMLQVRLEDVTDDGPREPYLHLRHLAELYHDWSS